MSAAAPTPRTSAAGWVAVVVGNAALGVLGAFAVVLWAATAYGLGQRWGWAHPDPTLFDDGLGPWVLLAVVATAVDLALVLGLNAVTRRLVPVHPAGRRRRVAAVAHLAVAVGLGLALLTGALG
jgi:uncharacterized membrane protein